MLPTLVQELDGIESKVIVVDNASGDDSVERISSFINQNGFGSLVEVVDARKNGGFSFGNNLAVTHYLQHYNNEPDFVLLLNPDTKVKKGAIKELLSFVGLNEVIGIAGSGLENQSGGLQRSAFRFHTLMSELLSGLRLGVLDKLFSQYLVAPEIDEVAQKVDWVAGASMLIRYKVFKDVGMMDEHYFLYYEETDFCLQAKALGWETWYVPTSRVLHYEGQSTGVVSGDDKRRRRPKYWFESRQYYFKKNHGVVFIILADLFWGIGFTLFAIRLFLFGKKATYPKDMWFDFWKNSIFFAWMTR
jgi:hypothetical protein